MSSRGRKRGSNGETVSSVLGSLSKTLGKPGLPREAVGARDDVPMYRAAPDAADVLIRTLRGKEQRGRFDASGRFRTLSRANSR